ncbi:MAG TPA: threonine--tRNA ligase, partial [Candidatus Nanopusillus sp.]|nr:threonine--tRNA ligase [Candidatus Nanopusillus sp.]
MKVLFLHTDFIKVFPKQKAIKLAEQDPKELDVKDALVAFVSVEERDKISLAKELVKNIKDVATRVGVNRIVLYPYVHLTNKPAKPEIAYRLILESEQLLKREGFEVYRAPFGWYKVLEMKVKGHPLSELSRIIREKTDIKENLESFLKEHGLKYEISEEEGKIIVYTNVPEEKERKKSNYNKIFLILYPNGKEYMILGEENNKLKVVDFQKIKDRYRDVNSIVYDKIEVNKGDIEYLDKSTFNKDFVKLLDKEALGKPFKDVNRNPIRETMERFGFEWENLSDYGHMRYKPYAALLVDLISEYAIKIATGLNFPVYIIKGTNMFDLEKGPVAAHVKLYGDRLYELKTDKSKFVLRYAACFQQFAIAKDLIVSYKDLPFGMLEIADSYRFEQPGETLLGFRLRKFWMPDLHIFCKNPEEASKYFYYMHKIIMDEIKKLNRDYELLINYGSPEFYLKYKNIAIRILQAINKPALVHIYPPSEGRYWIINVEYHIIDLLGRPREIGTTQIDIGNGKRFEITYVDENNKEHYVVIIHNAI